MLSKFLSVLLFVAVLHLAAADMPKTLPVRGFYIPALSPNCLDEFIEEDLAPRSVNVLILRVDYAFQFTSRPEMADKGGLSREQARKLAEVCRKHQIRIIPLIDLLAISHGNPTVENC